MIAKLGLRAEPYHRCETVGKKTKTGACPGSDLKSPPCDMIPSSSSIYSCPSCCAINAGFYPPITARASELPDLFTRVSSARFQSHCEQSPCRQFLWMVLRSQMTRLPPMKQTWLRHSQTSQPVQHQKFRQRQHQQSMKYRNLCNLQRRMHPLPLSQKWHQCHWTGRSLPQARAAPILCQSFRLRLKITQDPNHPQFELQGALTSQICTQRRVLLLRIRDARLEYHEECPALHQGRL